MGKPRKRYSAPVSRVYDMGNLFERIDFMAGLLEGAVAIRRNEGWLLELEQSIVDKHVVLTYGPVGWVQGGAPH